MTSASDSGKTTTPCIFPAKIEGGERIVDIIRTTFRRKYQIPNMNKNQFTFIAVEVGDNF